MTWTELTDGSQSGLPDDGFDNPDTEILDAFLSRNLFID